MSVESTQQPSFTVTAGILPLDPTSELSSAPDIARSPSPSTCDSTANRFENSTEPNVARVRGLDDEQSESLQQWTETQRKANGRLSVERAASIAEGTKNEDGHEIPDGLQEADDDVTGNGRPSLDELRKLSETQISSNADVPDPANENDNDNAELDNVSTPANSLPPQNNELLTDPSMAPAKRTDARPSPSMVKHARTPLQPVNDFSPHKTRKFAMPTASKVPLGMKRRVPAPRDEPDSFADNHVAPPKPPVERLTRMLEGYKSVQSDVLEDDKEEELEVPAWEGSVMKAQETDETGPDTMGVGSASNGPHEGSNGHGASDPSQASQSVPQVSPERPDPSAESPTSRWLAFPTSPVTRPKRFGGMLDSQSSESMPGDVQFSQHEDLESQRSTHSIPIIATQSMPRQMAYLSSPPASPDPSHHTQSHSIGTYSRHTHSTVQTNSGSVHRHSTDQKGTTQEPTQLVTEDEVDADPTPPLAPPSPTSAGTRRALPSARAWRAGRAVISQPADGPSKRAEVADGPSTVATPQAKQALRQATTGPPLALEETFVDPDQEQSDWRASSPAPPPLVHPSSPPLSPPGPSDRVHEDVGPPPGHPMEATYIDPTITSLPPPAPRRSTPRQYGKQKVTERHSPSSPTPRGPATPESTAGPPRLPSKADIEMEDAGSTSRSPAPPGPARPTTTKSGRVPKRKRRDSSASMSGSSSSSEELDPLDESYRPVLKTASKLKSRSSSKAVNPNLKRVKRDSRSSSTSCRTSGSTSVSAAAGPSIPLTTPPPSSPPISNYVLAYWHPNWFVGRVRGMDSGRYEIDFEDETFTDVATDRVRRGILRKGDKVKTTENKLDEYEVMEDWHGEQRGVKVRGGRYIPLKKLFVRNAVVKSDFTDRIITPRELGFDADSLPPPVRTVSGPIKPAVSTPSSDIFSGKVFIITSMHTADSKYQARQKRFIDDKIVRNGGKYCDQWEDLFDLPASGFGSTLASTSAPFLLQETQSAALTPKMLVSLAKGIPCLSVSYVDDAIADPNVSSPST